jgi:hypothetical protein
MTENATVSLRKGPNDWHGRIVRARHTPRELFTDSRPERWEYRFANGYGASVIRGQYTYGGSEGKWEMAVLDSNADILYNTPVIPGEDVLGWLTDEQVEQLLERISELTPETIQAFREEQRLEELRTQARSVTRQVRELLAENREAFAQCSQIAQSAFRDLEELTLTIIESEED